jgi:hypothetical protein
METSTTPSSIPKDISKGIQLTADALGHETVTIKVGPEEKIFTVHKKLLCGRSDFFLKAFSNGFAEAQTGVISFPEDTEEAFDKFVTWLYTGNFTLPNCPTTEVLEGEFEAFIGQHLIPTFILADKLCANEFMNKAMDSFANFHKERGLSVFPKIVHDIFQQLGGQSKLSQYTAGNFAFYVDAASRYESLKPHIQTYIDVCKTNPEFFQAVFEWQYNYGGKMGCRKFHTLTKQLGRCFFHVHGKEEICHLQKEN